MNGENTYGMASNHYITNGKEKYIWFSQTGDEQYFDLEKNPKELVNLINSASYQEKISYWRSKLIKGLEGREEGYSDGSRLFSGCIPKATLSHIKG